MWEKVIAIGTMILVVLTGVLVWLAFNRPAINWPMLGTISFVVLGLGIASILNYKSAKLRTTVPPKNSTAPGTRKYAYKFTLLFKKRDLAQREGITLKSKIRIAVRNDDGHIVQVHGAQWVPGPQGIPAQGLWFRLQPEASLGSWRSDKWKPEETTEVYVKPGETFLASVAIDPAFPDEDVVQRLTAGQLGGKLVLSLQCGRYPITWATEL